MTRREASFQYLLQPLEPLPDESDFVLRRLDALRRLLLERMHNPDVVAKLHGVHDPKRCA